MSVRSCLALIVAATSLAAPVRAQQATGDSDTFAVGRGSDDLLGRGYDSGAANRPVLPDDPFDRAGASGNSDDNLATGSVPAPQPVLPSTPPPTVPAGPPDAPLGLRMGSFVAYPSIETGVEYTDNVFRNDGGKRSGDVATIIRPSLKVDSDWSRHALSLEATGEYELFSKSSSEDSTTVSIKVNGRIDVRARTTIDLAAEYEFDQDDRGSSTVAGNAAELPDQHTVRLGGGITQRFNRVAVQLRGAIEDLTVADTRLIGGGRDNNKDRDYTETSATLRVSYEHTPAVQPFGEITLSQRDHDQKLDDNGQRRDSDGYVVSGGVALDFGVLLSGELAFGFIHAGFDDPALRDIDDVFARAALIWRPSELTTVTAALHTGVEETTIADASGSVQRRAELTVAHALRENIILSAGLSYEREDFTGSSLVEKTFELDAGVEYRLNRNVAVRWRYNYENFSDNAGGGFASNSLFLGLELRK